jgi:hypothetical protein
LQRRTCRQRRAGAGVLVLGANRLDADRARVELDPVRVYRHRADRLEVCADGVERALSLPQQIQIARRAVGLIRPHAQEHRSLEHKAVAQLGDAEPIQEALEAVGGEQRLVLVARLPSSIEEPRGNRGRKVPLLGGHAIASR